MHGPALALEAPCCPKFGAFAVPNRCRNSGDAWVGFRLKNAENIRAFRNYNSKIYGSFAYEPIKSAFKCKKKWQSQSLDPYNPWYEKQIAQFSTPCFIDSLWYFENVWQMRSLFIHIPDLGESGTAPEPPEHRPLEKTPPRRRFLGAAAWTGRPFWNPLGSRVGVQWWCLPSGKHTKNYGKSPFLMGKSTINGHFQ